jgi:hypothetical protein
MKHTIEIMEHKTFVGGKQEGKPSYMLRIDGQGVPGLPWDTDIEVARQRVEGIKRGYLKSETTEVVETILFEDGRTQ